METVTNILKKIDGMLEWVQNWILIITGTLVGAMILVNAVCRFLVIDWFGSEELTMFVAFWLYFTGAAAASRDRTHISADMMGLFTNNPKIRGTVYVIRDIIAMIMSAIFTVWFFEYVGWQISLGAKSPVYKLPIIINTIPILISYLLGTLYLVRHLFKDIAMAKSGNKEGAE